MKEFMMIFIGPDYGELGFSPEQVEERMGRWFAWGEKMATDGIETAGNALMPQGKHIKGEDKVVTDGPYIEGKELVGGYYIFKAKDLDGAVEVAKGFPDFDIEGKVEVREVMVFDQ